MKAYRYAVAVFAVAFVCLGFALLIRTATHHGGTVGYLVGALFIGLGAGRLTLLSRR